MKIVKGMRDWDDGELIERDDLIRNMAKIFRNHGALQIDTPVAELKSTLSSRYGEEEKLIFDLADQGGEISCLRFDLTIPFMRYLDKFNLKYFKRYQIGKVYRRDQPNIGHGRLREFMQVDYDVVGNHPPMVAEAEVIDVLIRCLQASHLQDFKVVINDRRLLNAMLARHFIPDLKWKTVCSSIDKLDKLPWDAIASELIGKGLNDNMLINMEKDICRKGSIREMIEILRSVNEELYSDYSLLKSYLDALGITNFVEIDFSLARGLDYYDGIVFEVKKEGLSNSLAAGGRYNASFDMDNRLPALGFSIGIDRLMQAIERSPKVTDIYKIGIVTAGIVPHEDVLNVCKLLWDAEIYCTYDMKTSTSTTKQLQKYVKNDYSVAVILGEEEMQKHLVIVRNLATKEQQLIAVDRVVEVLGVLHRQI